MCLFRQPDIRPGRSSGLVITRSITEYRRNVCPKGLFLCPKTIISFLFAQALPHNPCPGTLPGSFTSLDYRIIICPGLSPASSLIFLPHNHFLPTLPSTFLLSKYLIIHRPAVLSQLTKPHNMPALSLRIIAEKRITA